MILLARCVMVNLIIKTITGPPAQPIIAEMILYQLSQILIAEHVKLLISMLTKQVPPVFLMIAVLLLKSKLPIIALYAKRRTSMPIMTEHLALLIIAILLQQLIRLLIALLVKQLISMLIVMVLLALLITVV